MSVTPVERTLDFEFKRFFLIFKIVLGIETTYTIDILYLVIPFSYLRNSNLTPNAVTPKSNKSGPRVLLLAW